jgi:ubiquitin C-terminal hydrolase
VVNKPTIKKDENEKEDSIKSKEEWIIFLRRNQSVLVDFLYGKYKSTLFCPECKKISTTFDPFLSLSLPLAGGKNYTDLICYFIFYDSTNQPFEFKFKISETMTVVAIRKRVAMILNIPEYSFIITRVNVPSGVIALCNSAYKVSSTSSLTHKFTYFLYQIDSSLPIPINQSYNLNTNLFQELQSKKRELNTKLSQIIDDEAENGNVGNSDFTFYSFIEDSGTQTIINLSNDNNNYLPDNYLQVTLYLTTYENSDLDSNGRRPFSIPRFIYLNKAWSTGQVHRYIFDYFKPIFNKFISSTMNNYETYFPEAIDSNIVDIKNYHYLKGYPYVIRLRNIFGWGECLYCGRTNCDSCLLPFSDDVTIQDLLNKLPLNNGYPIDNTYYYIDESDRAYFKLQDRDFSFEITVLNSYVDKFRTLTNRLNLDLSSDTIANNTIDIYSCFKKFIKTERLEANNEWYCPTCQKHQLADKKMQIYKAPHILIIHLKRFKNGYKLDDYVDFPVSGLDITEYVINDGEGIPLIYDLFAVSNHMGGVSGGHYTAYAKNPIMNSWFGFNDSSVYQTSEGSVVTNNAYVLFYRRRNLTDFLNIGDLYTRGFVNYEVDGLDAPEDKN